MENNFNDLINKSSVCQFISLLVIGTFFLLIKKNGIFFGLLVAALASFFYFQLIKLSFKNKLFALFGFPIRLFLIGIPTAILVTNFHSNLIALFIGFVFSQAIYFLFVFSYAKKGTLSKK